MASSPLGLDSMTPRYARHYVLFIGGHGTSAFTVAAAFRRPNSWGRAPGRLYP